MVKERLRKQGRSSILDLGPPTKNKLAFFADCSCRIYSNNFPDSFYGRLNYPGSVHSFSNTEFEEMLPGWESLEFDLVLAWDYFDYMDKEGIKRFAHLLATRCRQDALLHFLITQTSQMSKTPALIDLGQGDQIRYVTSGETRPATRHAVKVLEDLMPGFGIRKLCLLKNGLQEHLFIFDKINAATYNLRT